jgi:2'-5' RNA ligase
MGSSYSIWLMPEGAINEKLSEIILGIGQKHNSPKFSPHVTLVGGFDGEENKLILKAEKLAKLLKPFKVKLTRVTYLDEFFRSLFILVEKTPEFLESVSKAREIFDFHKTNIPHLSLIYGNFSEETKLKIIKDIGNEFNIEFDVKYIHLVINNEKEKVWTKIKSFELK